MTQQQEKGKPGKLVAVRPASARHLALIRQGYTTHHLESNFGLPILYVYLAIQRRKP